MNKKTSLRNKLSLDKQTIRRLDPATMGDVAGAKPTTNTSLLSVLMQCSWLCQTASCFVDDTCGIHGCGMH
ncbi:MAG: class I lanthipeptide [Deltaproteobacteria bacterium]|nr:class I lanthipeptide [Deltaproteobacteria bacterium]